MKIKSLGMKISLIVTLLIVVIIGIIYWIVMAETKSLINELTTAEAEAANISFARALEEQQDDAYIRASIIAHEDNVIEYVLNNDSEGLKHEITTFMDGMDIITICNKNGTALARGHNDTLGDNVLNQKSLATPLSTGQGVRTIEHGGTSGLSTRGSAPIKDSEGNIIGAVSCGNDLSLTQYIDDIKKRSNCEVTLFDGDTRINTTLIDDQGNRVIGTKASQTVIDLVLEKRQNYSLQTVLFGATYAAYYSPLIRDDEVLGILFVGIHIDSTLAHQKTMLMQVLQAAIISGIMACVLIFLFSLFSVSKPLKKIGVVAEKISSGNLNISSSSSEIIKVNSADEIGQLARALEHSYMQLRGYIGEIQANMQSLAKGDLTTECTYDFKGDFILIKDSINIIMRDLNLTMSKAYSSTSQVADGAKQIADGAQTLAQGSTEQAASVQQLSSAISKMAEKTKTNAEMADRASSLANSIMKNAETGSRQMDEMMTAVSDINQASQSISRVIKVIDDIAFQTNILALNAAVEAARAGQHGKGFAVVAEEVRNLAAKSAEAAKETSDMIQNSMEKAELGAKIASETSSSLTEIVSGINESTQIVAQIAKSSTEQTLSISQINTGIDQVAQVVQQNSATAEQSAAASQEMSGQASVLEQLISQFKLNNSSGNKRLAQARNKQLEIAENSSYTQQNVAENYGKY
ncbi:MAG: methyl-accepting chemotaxis protein [Firmicutes bacterium]|nr:methyl-accepting chemotaxis protein [Bacillota bacterium]